jgi:hypothetical protein
MELPPLSPRSPRVTDDDGFPTFTARPLSPGDPPRTHGPQGTAYLILESDCLNAPLAPNVAIGARFLGTLVAPANDWRLYAVPRAHPAWAPDKPAAPVDELGGWIDD